MLAWGPPVAAAAAVVAARTAAAARAASTVPGASVSGAVDDVVRRKRRGGRVDCRRRRRYWSTGRAEFLGAAGRPLVAAFAFAFGFQPLSLGPGLGDLGSMGSGGLGGGGVGAEGGAGEGGRSSEGQGVVEGVAHAAAPGSASSAAQASRALQPKLRLLPWSTPEVETRRCLTASAEAADRGIRRRQWRRRAFPAAAAAGAGREEEAPLYGPVGPVGSPFTALLGLFALPWDRAGDSALGWSGLVPRPTSSTALASAAGPAQQRRRRRRGGHWGSAGAGRFLPEIRAAVDQAARELAQGDDNEALGGEEGDGVGFSVDQ